jgi:isohexenylglutaconyl-CoA hydratase
MEECWWQQSADVVAQVIQSLGPRRCTSANWDYDTPKYSIEGQMAVVKLDDIRNANGLTQKLTSALMDIAVELHQRPDIKVLLVTAGGAYFCTGGAFASTDPTDWMYGPQMPPGLSKYEKEVEGGKPTALLFYLLNTLPQFKVASIRGESMGAGNSLVCSMDYVVAPNTKKTKCNFKEATRGLAACMSWQGVVSKIGIPRTRCVALCSDVADPATAKALGIVDEVAEGSTAEVAMKTSDENARAKAEQVAALPMEEITKMKTTGSGCKTKLFPVPAGAKDCVALQSPVPDYWAAVDEVIEACGATGRPAPARLSKQMWPHSCVKLSMKGQSVAVLKLTSPDTNNAIDKDMVAGLLDAAIELHKSKGKVRVVVIKAEGENFCAGLAASLAADDTKLQKLLFLMHMLPMYVVGVVQGKAAGLGVTLACLCDRVVMMSSATFSFAGLAPSQGGEYVVARIGTAKLKELASGSSAMTAETAKEMGLAWTLAKGAEDVEAEIAKVCEMATQCAPNAVAESKGFLQRLGGANIVYDSLVSFCEHIANRNQDPEFDDAIAAVMDPDHKPHYRKDNTFQVTTTKPAKALTGPPAQKALTGHPPAKALPTSVMI